MTVASAQRLARLYVEGVNSSAASVAMSPEPVFRARGLTKVYRMGDVEVYALRGVGDDGHMEFHRDHYERDGAIAAALEHSSVTGATPQP